MGAYLSEPVTTKESEDGEGNNLRYGASCMQGWRVSQEDAHNCLPNFDKDSSLFAVYDGHGGAEVAIYLARRFPELLKNCKSYQEGNWEESLKETYLKIDAGIPTNSVIVELQQIAKQDGSGKNESVTDYEEENVNALYEEATMPLEKLVALYQSKTGAPDSNDTNDSSSVDQPCSSKAIQLSSPSKTETELVTLKKEGGSGSGASANSSVPSSASDLSGADKEDAVNKVEDLSKNSDEDAVLTNNLHSNADKDKPISSSIPVGIENNHASNAVTEILSETETLKANNKETQPEEGSTPVENGSSTVIENAEDESEKVNTVEVEKPAKNGDCELNNKHQIVNVKISNIETNGSPPPKARKGKVHPTPPKKEESPKKTRNRPPQETNVYSALTNSDSDSSESADDYVAGLSDSDDDDESLANSSSTDNEGEEAEEGNEEDEDSDEDGNWDADEEEDDDHFLNDIQEPGFDSGSTAVVAFLKWEGEKLGLWVANAGDSRCVVCRNGKAVDMSFDHKPEELKETRRIVAAGGKVTHDGRVNGGLNLSRAIGDHSYKQNPKMSPEEQMITPLPDIQHMELDPATDHFIVMACDGIWNSMSSQEVVDFVSTELKNHDQISKVCEEIFDACLSPDTSGDGTGCDNMTAIIINISKLSSGVTKRRLSSPEEEQDESKKPKLETEV